MRLSWNEVRARAAAFADDWRDAAYEKGETQSFYNDFFSIFGVRRRSVARYEEHVKKLDDRSGFIDLFWPGVLLVEQKSAGRDLEKAYGQAGEYFDALPERERPRYILVSDFRTFELHDLDERETASFALADLPAHVEKFGFVMGVQRRAFRDQDPANIEAAELVGRLHDMLSAAGYRGHNLRVLLVRTVFCLFADDTGIFEPRDIFFEFVETRTAEDGADLGPWLCAIVPGAGYAGGGPADFARRWTLRGFPMSTARCSKVRCRFPLSTPPCGMPCWTPAASTGPGFHLRFSARCSSP